MQWGLGVLGWSPKQFWSSTVIELDEAIKGWKVSNGAKDEEKTESGHTILSAQEVESLTELIQEHG